MERFLSIDLLRGLAIVLMIQVHFTDNLSARDANTAWLYDASGFLGGLSAPLFAFLSGLSYCLWVRKQEMERRKERDITRTTLKRGLFLFLLGMAFNFCIWLPEETFNWDILTLLGTALLVLAYARKLPAPVLALICTMLLLISPVVRMACDFSAYWVDYEYSYEFTFQDIAAGFVSNGYFPIFPWLAVPIAGFLCGDLVFRRRMSGRNSIWKVCAFAGGLMTYAILGIVFAVDAANTVAKHYVDGLTEFPASTCYLGGMLGAMLLALVLLHRWIDGTPSPDFASIRYLRRCSAFSLTIYLLHHVVMLWPLWIVGKATGHADSTVYWRKAISTPHAFALALGFLVASHFAMVCLEKHRHFSLESLMRRLCG